MNNPSITSFGEYIRGLRETLGLSIKEIAHRLTVDASLFGKIERDERPPTRELITKIATVLGQDEKVLVRQFLSDQLAYKILEQDADIEILKVAEEKVKYHLTKKVEIKRK